ncbi:putative aldouronate transport system substrate-binding protein [Paenibacillus endophyticus]|uniref:Putative aldouronate transport system substrate-binding protein n=1 Tax=Paenibacillus endophyticus TaxID=1294268 RepID=A0A7W5C3F4_9BACL|nr:extracellular solute-binding protein [Paenibacillus endophyticus]MBB3150440.1 putative aldouronate transport system substrate-binding protein [Paenibacillus endophyticus]
MRKPNRNKVKYLLAVLMLALILTACEQNMALDTNATDGNPISNEGVQSNDENSELSKYNPPIEVVLVRETSSDLEDVLTNFPGDTLEDNRWTRLYEDVLGIKIKYNWTAKGDLYQQKLGFALASGNIPDIVRVNAQQLRQLANEGLIQDLTDVYEQYAAPFTKDVLSQEGTGPFEAATIDGKLMAIPETAGSIEGSQFIWLRVDWLEKLGLQSPKTMDDLLAVSKAFTENDPDGNGKPDTYGLALTQYLWDPVMGLTDFMAGYEAYPNMWIKDDSGKLVYGAVQPEVKKALQVVQGMYADGQIDKEFAFKDGRKEKAMIAEGKIGIMYGEQWGSFIVQANYMNDPKAEWRPFPIVADSGLLPKVPLRFATSQFLAVRKEFEHPEAIVKLINLHLEKNWGVTAEYEKYYSTPYPVWQLSPFTPAPLMKNMEAYRQLKENRLTGDESVLHDEARAIKKNIDAYLTKNDVSGWGWERTYGPNGAFAILDNYEKNNQLMYESFVGVPTESIIEKQPILDTLKNKTFLNIILGRPIEEFDQFVEEWHRLGGNEMTTEVNQWYSEKGRNKE